MPIEYYSPRTGGAISTIIMQSAKELLARGHRVTVLTVPGDDPGYSVGEVVSIEARKKSDLNLVQRAFSKLAERRHGYDWPYFDFYLRSVIARLCEFRPDTIVLFNDLVSPGHIKPVIPNGKIFVWLQNEWRTRNTELEKCIAATNRFLTCSRYIADWTAKEHGIPADKFVVAHSGVDLELFQPREDCRAPRDCIRALFIGRIDRNKGPDIAVDAVRAMQLEGANLSMTVAGGLWFYGHGREMEDPYFRELHGKMELAGVDYAGHVDRDRAPALIRQHDIAFVLSRSNEPFGLVVLECMASGLGVIASNRGGLPEAVGPAGTLVDPDDFDAVTDQVRRLVTVPAALSEAKRSSLDWANRNGWSKCADVLERALAPS